MRTVVVPGRWIWFSARETWDTARYTYSRWVMEWHWGKGEKKLQGKTRGEKKGWGGKRDKLVCSFPATSLPQVGSIFLPSATGTNACWESWQCWDSCSRLFIFTSGRLPFPSPCWRQNVSEVEMGPQRNRSWALESSIQSEWGCQPFVAVRWVNASNENVYSRS